MKIPQAIKFLNLFIAHILRDDKIDVYSLRDWPFIMTTCDCMNGTVTVIQAHRLEERDLINSVDPGGAECATLFTLSIGRRTQKAVSQIHDCHKIYPSGF